LEDSYVTETAYAYNWTRPYVVEALHESDVRKPFEDFNKQLDDKVRLAIDNTVEFVRHINRLVGHQRPGE
jgi:hypothetical protein